MPSVVSSSCGPRWTSELPVTVVPLQRLAAAVWPPLFFRHAFERGCLPALRMKRAACAILLIQLASAAGAAGHSDGSLARSAAHPFRTARSSAGEPLLQVERLDPGSAAARAGLRDGDII